MLDYIVVFFGIFGGIISIVVFFMPSVSFRKKLAIFFFIIICTVLIINFAKENPSILNERQQNIELEANKSQSAIEDQLESNEEINEKQSTIEETIEVETSSSEEESKEIGSKPFATVYEKHIPKNAGINVSLAYWDLEENEDSRGQNHQEGSYLLTISNYFNMLGSSLSNDITVDIHFPYNLEYEGSMMWYGYLVIEKDSVGSDASASVQILIDGKEIWRTDEDITGSTVAPVRLPINIENIEGELIIRVICRPKENGLKIGIVDFEAQ